MRRSTTACGIGFWLACICGSAAAWAQDDQPPSMAPELRVTLDPGVARFRRFDARDGLSQDSVLAIEEDGQGLIWLGTQDGLNRFDGLDIRVFRPEVDDVDSLSGPWAGRLAFDAEGQLWVGSTVGLSRLDPATGKAQRLSRARDRPGGLPGQAVLALHVDARGRVWVGTEAGLSRWVPEQNAFLSYLPPVADPRVMRLTSSPDGQLWVGTLVGVYRFDPNTGQFDQPADLQAVRATVSALLIDADQRLWIGTEGDGLWRVEVDGSNAARHWRHDRESDASLADDRVRSLLQDSAGRLWVGHETGLDRLDRLDVPSSDGSRSTFFHYRHARHDPRSLGRGAVVALRQDRHGDLWVGTWEGGFSILSPRLNRMLSIHPDMPAAAALRAASVRAVLADAGGWWWAGEDGLYRYEHGLGDLHLVAGSEGLFGFELHRDTYQSMIWVGSSRGLWQLDPRSETLSKPEQSPRIRNARVRRVWADKERIWLALMPDGVLVLERETLRELAFHPIGGIVSFIRPLDEKTLLVGAQDGLYWFDRQEATLRHRHVVGANGGGPSVLPGGPTHLLQARNGGFWMGSSGAGLLKVSFDAQAGPDATRFEAFDRRLGLAADSVGWVEEDQYGRLWLSTTMGISRFDPDRGQFRNYGFNEGTLGRSYWVGAGGKDDAGVIAFGGFDGATVLFPEALRNPESPPAPLIAGYRLGNAWTDLLGAAQTQPLELPASDKRSLSFRITAMEHLLPQQLRFDYRLRGFDDVWVEAADQQRVISFTNLPPGQFQFEVRTRNADQQTSDTLAQFALSVVPSWWQTPWARLLAVLLLLTAVVMWGRYRLTRAQRQNDWLSGRIRERTADIEQLVEIGKELTATLDVEQAMERVYQRVAARLDAHVFAIAICEPEHDRLRELYVKEAGQRANGIHVSLQEVDRPAVWCVRERLPLITSRQGELLNYVSDNLPAAEGDETESIVYLPLVIGDRVIGCFTVQSLKCDAYSPDQIAFLEVLASYTAIAVDNALSYQRLDDVVAQRTQDILTLSEIGRELTATLDPEQAMRHVYARVSEVLDTFVFFIGLLEDDRRIVRLAYAVENGERLQATSYPVEDSWRPGAVCIREAREIVIQNEQEARRKLQRLGPPLLGVATQSMVFIPLIHNGRASGYLSVQSLRENAYSSAQLEFLRVLASYTAIALENARNYQTLDHAVAARTAELQQAMDDLRSAQHSLIEREKMASLGGLVAGVAHEVNTPLGIAVTAASHLEEEARSLFLAMDAHRLTRGAMADFRAACEEGFRLIVTSLRRAHVLIGSFKRVAVDQSSEERRRFDLQTTLEEILFSLRPSYRRAGHQLHCVCPPDIELDSYPGALFQVITNLVTNASQHAFDGLQSGTVSIEVSRLSSGRVLLRVSDDGRGMDGPTQAKIFDPFFTTRRSSGGSGLGMHLVYNLVTQLLGGTIRVHSEPGRGARFDIELPLGAPKYSNATISSVGGELGSTRSPTANVEGDADNRTSPVG